MQSPSTHTNTDRLLSDARSNYERLRNTSNWSQPRQTGLLLSVLTANQTLQSLLAYFQISFAVAQRLTESLAQI